MTEVNENYNVPEEVKERVFNIIQILGIDENYFSIKKYRNQIFNSSQFVSELLLCLKNNYLNNPIDAEFVVLIFSELATVKNNDSNSTVMLELVEMFNYCSFSNRSLHRLLDALRSGTHVVYNQYNQLITSNQKPGVRGDDRSSNLIYIPMQYHANILSIVQKIICNDNPSYISFPGDKDSFLQLSQIPITCTRAYTMAIWIKMPVEVPNKGFILFRSRSPISGIDAIISNPQYFSSINKNNEQLMGSMNTDSDTVTMVLTIRTNTEKKGKDEMQGTISITPGKWQLITISQSMLSKDYIPPTSDSSKSQSSQQPHVIGDRLIVTIDGKLVLEQIFKYPFLTPTTDSLWVFGLGFNGFMSSMTLYPEEFSISLAELMYSLGPSVSDLSVGVSGPQSSFDSGHLILGSQIAKGNLAAKACRFRPIFSIQQYHLSSDSSLPLSTTGKIYPEHIEMVPRMPEYDSPLNASMTGGVSLSSHKCFIDVWSESGGVSLVLYMIWCYCRTMNTYLPNKSQKGGKESEVNKKIEESMSCLKLIIEIASKLVLRSTDMKEQLLQMHGFHIIGLCLSNLKAEIKKQFIDKDLIIGLIGLVNALGPDAKKGDGIAAAMQGVLFDFRIWGSCKLSILTFYLENIASLTLETGDQLFKSIGVQRILDIFRLHIVKFDKHVEYDAMNNIDFAGKSEDDPMSENKLVIECFDCIHRLLIITMDAAKTFALKMKTTVVPEIEMLLKCLEETNSCLIAERILRILANIRITSSVSLIQAFIMNRYHETTVLSLLTKKGFSIEVRSNSVINLFWLLGDELRPLPMQMIQSRRILNSITTTLIPLNANNPNSRAKYVSNLDSNRIKSLNKQILELMKPIEKAWMTMNMLSQVLSKAFTEGTWGKVYPSTIEIAESNLFDFGVDNVSYVVDESNFPKTLHNSPLKDSFVDIDLFINSIVHNGKLEAWLLLPFLPVILSRSSLTMCQSVVMALNVALKTDESHCEAISSLPDRSWIKLFISIACIGESFTLSHSHNEELKADLSIASTCTEISLDGLSLIIEYKTRHHFNDTWSTWNCLQNCIRIACSTLSPDSNEIELKFLKRCVSLVFQRLLKSSDGWNINLLNCLNNVFSLIDARKLCGQSEPQQQSLKNRENLLDLEYDVITSTSNLSIQSAEESQILCYMMDLMASLRKASIKGAMNGYEWKVMKPALLITLNSLKNVSESIVDRVASEVFNHLKYMTEPWAPLNAAQFKAHLLLIISHLRGVIEDVSAKEYLKGRYSALVFCIMHMFIDIRHLIAIGKKVPEHVLPALEDLVGVVNCNDIDLIFKLMDVTMRTANSISFQEDDQVKTKDDNLLVELQHLSQNPAQKLEPIDISEHGVSEIFDSNDTANLSPKVKDLLEGSSLFGRSSPVDEVISSNSTLEDNIQSIEQVNEMKPIIPPESDQFIPIAAVENVAVSAANPPVNSNRDARYKKWIKIRQGILSERVDSERGRLSRSMDTLDLSSQATNHFWKKSRRKIESELFLESHKCQWKLGVAQEGHFPGRKRLVFRPRFHSEYGNIAEASLDDSNSLNDDSKMTIVKDTDELNRALAIACAGYIQDVTVSDAADVNGNLLGLPAPDGKTSEELNNEEDGSINQKHLSAPGTGWGVVDVDDSEEGYGVVGIAHSEQSPSLISSVVEKETNMDQSNSVQVIPVVNDMMGDVRQLEENYKQGRCIETGPCHSGTKRVGSGPAKLECRVIMVTASGNFWGSLSFNGKEIFFSSSFEPGDGHKEDNAAVNLVKQLRMRRRRWVLSSLSAIYMRRFRLRDSAMEVFFHRGKHRNFFVDFGHTIEDAKKRNEFARALIAAAPTSAFKQSPTMSAFRLVYEHGVQEKWLSGNMSNFDYLMALNTIAGRSYNDLCQYPVFPWIIAEYNTPTIDLNDRSIYRDLSKPMGALNENRLKEFLDRFNSFEDNVSSGIPAFMYGSHYSTMVGVVLHFLVRLQPFAALHKEMQNGHFDVPDRLFSSIPRSFKHNTNQLSEVKELTPEWFTTPEMFKNINNFNLGKTQDGDLVDDVELPKWASTAEEFVRINREALESDYVTEHLHEWIDLIFGYKQRGPDSVEACNVFYYLTYYGSVNHYMITDESLRRATELQIAHFGQIPMQLFKIPHPARKINVVTSESPPTRSITKCFIHEDFVQPTCDEETLSINSSATFINKQTNSIIVNLSILNDRIICVLDSGVVEVLKYSTSDNAKLALSLFLSDSRSLNRRRVGNLELSEHGNKSDDLIDMNEPITFNVNVKSDILIMPKNEPLIYVEKEFTHFDIIPRIPLSKYVFKGKEKSNKQESDNRNISTKLSSESKLEQAAALIKFNDTSNIVISTGHSDGRVCVREIDVKTGFIKSTGDYRAHRKRVISLATDSIPFGNTDVIASCDETGQIMVWTVSKIRNANGTSSLVISRRPQRLFRCEFKLGLYCDLSWQMGIVVVASDLKINLFSIERDEMLRSFFIEYPVDLSIPKSGSYPCTGSPMMVFGENKSLYNKQKLEKPKCFMRRIALSDNGNIIVHIEVIKIFESLLELDDQIRYQHCLISYSLSGCQTGLQDSFNSAITFMDCPDRGSIVVTGHSDGNVILYEACNLSIIYKFKPNLCCIYQNLSLTPSKLTKDTETFILPNNSEKNTDSSKNSSSIKLNQQSSQLTTQCSPIICISFGPNRKSPAVICITTESGNVFFRAFPDFVKWERNRIPSTLAQLASVPIKAVKGTIQQAQNWTAETAGVLAQNAKNFADELKKMNKNPIVKGFASFFGMGKQDSDDNNNK